MPNDRWPHNYYNPDNNTISTHINKSSKTTYSFSVNYQKGYSRRF